MAPDEVASIHAAIAHLETRQEEHILRNEAQHEAIGVQTGELRKMLTGNGEIGFSERLRNVERVAAGVMGWGRWIKFGVAGLMLKALWDIVIQQQGA